MRRYALLCVSALALGACTGPIGYQPPPCAGQIVRPTEAPERRLHVRALVVHRGKEQRHEVVLDSTPGLVTAVGLTPMGTVAYELSHDAEGLHAENGVGRFLGLDPRIAYDAIAHGLLMPPDASQDTLVDVYDAAEGPRRVKVARLVCRYTAEIVVVSDRETPTPAAPPAP